MPFSQGDWFECHANDAPVPSKSKRTIPTTTSRSLSCGSVCHAIARHTRRARSGPRGGSLTMRLQDLGRFAVVEGAYWYCADYHEGQASRLYRHLSKLGRYYKPGPSVSSSRLEDDSREVYEMLEA